MAKRKYWAHISNDGQRRHLLEEHLASTAALAKQFGAECGVGEFNLEGPSETSGYLHDSMKVQPGFQARLEGSKRRCDHSTPAMQEAAQINGLAAHAVGAHHSGLLDYGTKFDPPSDATFMARMKRPVQGDISGWEEVVPVPLESLSSYVPPYHQLPQEVTKGAEAFAIRMVLSCLVDADHLDTEAFMCEGKSLREPFDSIRILNARLDRHMARIEDKALDTAINRERRRLRLECEEAAGDCAGLFTLTAATGSGKTYSAMSFALKHALHHDKRRVIYVAPYVNITSQTALVFKEVFGRRNVLEHHMHASYDVEEGAAADPVAQRMKLATENWEAPVIVTTAVQLFESLYSHRPSRCRKLHNITNSVIILDEAQMLPLHLLKPCLTALFELKARYGVTVLLSTATQPHFDSFIDLIGGEESLLAKIADGVQFREIARNDPARKQLFERVNYEVRKEELATHTLVEELRKLDQVLCIVNLKRTAQAIAMQLGDGTFLLSRSLSPYHQMLSLKTIKRRLDEGLPCRVIATSVVEAGVDIDFPTVYREFAGLESVIQAGGRCNREGKRAAVDSRVVVLKLSDAKMPSYILQNISSFEAVLSEGLTVDSSEAIHCYYTDLYQISGAGTGLSVLSADPFDDLGGGVKSKDLLDRLALRTLSRKFKMITDDDETLIYVVQRDADGHVVNGVLLEKLRGGELSRSGFRELARYAVPVYRHELERLSEEEALETIRVGNAEFNILSEPKYYDKMLGLLLGECD